MLLNYSGCMPNYIVVYKYSKYLNHLIKYVFRSLLFLKPSVLRNDNATL